MRMTVEDKGTNKQRRNVEKAKGQTKHSLIDIKTSL